MKIWAISDIHLTIAQARGMHMPFGIPEADICVVAGDVTDGMEDSLKWVGGCIRSHMPVVFVPGNHEYFGYDVPDARRRAASLSADLGVVLLDDGAADIGGVRFVGGTLWTDFMLFEGAGEGALFTQRECMGAAKSTLGDYDEIWATEASDRVIARTFSPRDAVGLHRATLSYLDRELALHEEGPLVVVTHHAPSPLSIAEKFSTLPTSAAFASDLNQFIEAYQVDAWLHGHVHDSFDYQIGRTRVVCNPRGYEAHQNPVFDPRKVIELSVAPRLMPEPLTTR